MRLSAEREIVILLHPWLRYFVDNTSFNVDVANIHFANIHYLY